MSASSVRDTGSAVPPDYFVIKRDAAFFVNTSRRQHAREPKMSRDWINSVRSPRPAPLRTEELSPRNTATRRLYQMLREQPEVITHEAAHSSSTGRALKSCRLVDRPLLWTLSLKESGERESAVFR